MNELHHDKTCFLHICCGLLILTSFSILTITLRGYQISIAYCLFSFVLLVISRFGFKCWLWVLNASVPGLCILLNFVLFLEQTKVFFFCTFLSCSFFQMIFLFLQYRVLFHHQTKSSVSASLLSSFFLSNKVLSFCNILSCSINKQSSLSASLLSSFFLSNKVLSFYNILYCSISKQSPLFLQVYCQVFFLSNKVLSFCNILSCSISKQSLLFLQVYCQVFFYQTKFSLFAISCLVPSANTVLSFCNILSFFIKHSPLFSQYLVFFHQQTTSSPLKQLGQSKSNFMWSLLRKVERKFI